MLPDKYLEQLCQKCFIIQFYLNKSLNIVVENEKMEFKPVLFNIEVELVCQKHSFFFSATSIVLWIFNSYYCKIVQFSHNCSLTFVAKFVQYESFLRFFCYKHLCFLFAISISSPWIKPRTCMSKLCISVKSCLKILWTWMPKVQY